MKKRSSEELIIGILKEAETSLKVAELCRNWKAKFGGSSLIPSV